MVCHDTAKRTCWGFSISSTPSALAIESWGCRKNGTGGHRCCRVRGAEQYALMRYDDALRTEHKIHLDYAPTQFPRHDDEHLDLRKPAERLDSCNPPVNLSGRVEPGGSELGPRLMSEMSLCES